MISTPRSRGRPRCWSRSPSSRSASSRRPRTGAGTTSSTSWEDAAPGASRLSEPSPVPLDLGGLFQHLHLDLTYLRIGHVDPEARQGSNHLLGAGLHAEAGQGVLDRPRLAGALPS